MLEMCNPYLIFMAANLPRATICLHVQYLKSFLQKTGFGVCLMLTQNLCESLQGTLFSWNCSYEINESCHIYLTVCTEQFRKTVKNVVI